MNAGMSFLNVCCPGEKGLAFLALTAALSIGSANADPASAGSSPAGTAQVANVLTSSLAAELQAATALSGVQLNLGADAANLDASVLADALMLVRQTGTLLATSAAGSPPPITYLGKGKVAERTASDLGRTADAGADVEAGDVQNSGRSEPLTRLVAFNAATQNEFVLDVEGPLLERLAAIAEASGDNGAHDPVSAASEDTALDRSGATPSAGDPWTSEQGESMVGAAPRSWSNDDDDRYRVYGFNAAVTNSVHRRIVQLGGGCSGTLVGPRHVVTAGHCLWSRRNQSWSNNFWVRAGANGTSSVASVWIDNQNIPAGQVLWYFTPSQYRNASNNNVRPHDFGILVLPARLGNTTGWLGRYYLTSSTLQGSSIFRRGYPVCVASTSNGTPRIDEPSPCSWNHLYGNASTCQVGEFANVINGWSHNINHSCDASAGDSGSPLYVYRNNGPGVTAVHVASLCETTAGGNQCTGSLVNRPLQAVRITPYHSGWISYFRSLFP